MLDRFFNDSNAETQQLWPRTPDGKLDMITRRLDLDDLLREAPARPRAEDRAGDEVRDL
jgi:hypothetical protein